MLFWVGITDISSSTSILYMVNGGKRLLYPTVGNFTYNLSSLAFQVYYLDGWRNITITDMGSLVWHLVENCSVVDVTQGRLPFWNTVNHSNKEYRPCKCQTVDSSALLTREK